MFTLTSLNLNGIRSATSKGLETWLHSVQADCLCVQEVKAQAADVAGQFESLAGMAGHFHFAEKKGYSGVGIYTRHAPSDVRVGYGSAEFDAEGRYVELRFDTPKRKLSIISCYFPSGSSGEERQQAKYRFLDGMYPHLQKLKRTREFVLCGDINIAHQEIDLKNWKGNRRARLDDALAERSRPGRCVPTARAQRHRRRLYLVEQPGPSLCQERGLALGLPPGYACAGPGSPVGRHLQRRKVLGSRTDHDGLRLGPINLRR